MRVWSACLPKRLADPRISDPTLLLVGLNRLNAFGLRFEIADGVMVMRYVHLDKGDLGKDFDERSPF